MKNGAVSYHSVIEAWMEPDTEHLSLLRLTQGSGSQITDHSSLTKKSHCFCMNVVVCPFCLWYILALPGWVKGKLAVA